MKKKLQINLPMAFMMLIGVGLIVYGIFAMVDIPSVATAAGVVAQDRSTTFFTQHRVLGLVLIAVGMTGSYYAALGQDGLCRKNFSQR